MIEIKAPNNFSEYGSDTFKIFLAGSIEMGKAIDWQYEVKKALFKFSDNLVILNPRREKWEANWKQGRQYKNFSEQVNWEQDAIEEADLIFMYFAPDTQSPISLLEFGQFINSGKMIVCCPEGYWRKGNIEIVCDRNGVNLYEDLDTAIKRLERFISNVFSLSLRFRK